MSILQLNSAKKVYFRESFRKQLIFKNLYEFMSKNKNYIKMLFFMDEIKHLLGQPAQVGCYLTKKFCYIKMLDSLSMLWRKVILEKYSEEPYEELLEKSATIWAQQLQLGKDISYSSVKTSLKSITLEALNFLREKHPEHSIFSTSDEYFSYWENNNIDNNYWSETEGTQIMDTLEEYMTDKLNFRSITSPELQYMCIDYVLESKCGYSIILYIIYESVARRLGLRCDLVQSSKDLYFLEVFWMPKYTFPTNYKGDICSLDEKSKKNMRSFQLLTYSDQNSIYKCYKFCSREIYIKTPTEMLTSVLQCDKMISSGCYSSISPKTILILGLKRMFPTRTKDVKFAVGMIVTHGDESTDCSIGVIIGWHQNSSVLIGRTHTLSPSIVPIKNCSYFSAEQTYYIILTKSDKLCCVKEGDIALTKPNWIGNIDIYHYFTKFEGTHYVPNEELAEVYPHDAETIFKE